MSASHRFTSATAFGAAAVFLVSWALLHHGVYAAEEIVDIPVYETYGNAIERGKIPYRDFRLEYPPGALPVFALPALASEPGDEASFRRAAEAALRDAKPLAHNAYKVELGKRAVVRALMRASKLA